jgi:proteasome lid subunit RPN8/RPN11
MTVPSFLSPLLPEMQAYAREVLPSEACGIVVNNKFVPCANVHSSPLTNFAIDAKDYAKAEKTGSIQAIFHSHTDFLSDFTRHDVRGCKQSNLPWLLYAAGANLWAYIDPTGNAPYIGRPWQYGIYDCYSLVRDFYKKEFAIELDDYERGEEFEWTSPEWRMFEKNFTAQGFVDAELPYRRGDVLLMQLQASFPNHVGVIADAKRNIFYQHLLGRLSEENICGGYWAKHTNRMLRHRSLA